MRTIFIALLLLPIAFAQIPWELSEQRCGNKILDKFELCDRDANESKCDELGEILGIDTACDTTHCTCVPRVNRAFCGNNKREGVEVCDGRGEDKCAEYGQKINLTLECNALTCGCVVKDKVPSGYNPIEIETLTNVSHQEATCGNKKIERAEDCDPPNTLCTTNTRQAGVCTAECKCLDPRIDEIEKAPENKSNITINTSGLLQPTNKTEEPEELPVEKGFFARLLTWIAKIFS